jgi:hypothetical protein
MTTRTRIALITVGAIVGFLSYTLPYLLDFIPKWDEEFKFFDKAYAVGISFGFGGILIGIAIDLDRPYKYYLMSIGVFFAGLFLTFLVDDLLDWTYKTRYYVLANLLISILCLVLLTFQMRSTP